MEDKARKYTLVFGTNAGSYSLDNDRLMYEFVQCILTNFDPVTMTVTLPDLFSDIKGKKPEFMEIVSVHNLPRTRMSIQAN